MQIKLICSWIARRDVCPWAVSRFEPLAISSPCLSLGSNLTAMESIIPDEDCIRCYILCFAIDFRSWVISTFSAHVKWPRDPNQNQWTFVSAHELLPSELIFLNRRSFECMPGFFLLSNHVSLLRDRNSRENSDQNSVSGKISVNQNFSIPAFEMQFVYMCAHW